MKNDTIYVCKYKGLQFSVIKGWKTSKGKVRYKTPVRKLQKTWILKKIIILSEEVQQQLSADVLL